jgi:hypothetical protein
MSELPAELLLIVRVLGLVIALASLGICIRVLVTSTKPGKPPSDNSNLYNESRGRNP